MRVSGGGEVAKMPASRVQGRPVVCRGRWLRTVELEDEEWLDDGVLKAPASFIRELAESPVAADLLTFGNLAYEGTTVLDYPMERDNVAAVPLTSYQEWLNALSQDTRRNARIGAKRGVRVDVVPFSDELVRGIKDIYDETPLRQGRRFWHYGKDLETVRRENDTYADRSAFLAAYWQDELIGFIKLVYVGEAASIMQILSKNRHFDKRPPHALIAKAVEVACAKGMRHLVYCKYVYGKKTNSSITEFKRRLGFVRVDYPRYYVPLTWKGRVALKLGLHHPFKDRLPGWLTEALLSLRSRYYNLRLRRPDASADAAVSET